ncbi:rhomboid family intramembrane serine protease [Kangiella sp. TOML190]|uniref:rhomboid family intramembrane serine protease n=1 Tax=Kangiella sp. TOML190 TaxID=2931351 RepID=UPI00203C2403|nr:rhomboid family intramembrane serine protease [Kangiella sp. TOML190]
MLLIPAENGFNKQQLPWVTFTLMALCIVAYISFQGNDAKVIQKALNHYQQQNLLALEKETFVRYAERYRPQFFYAIEDQAISEQELIQLIVFDKHFTERLKQQSNLSQSWQKKREHLNQLLEESSTHKYAFYPSEPSWFIAFSHMFMHGSIDHLIGNLIVLFLFGYNLELLLGKKKLLATYFISGLVAVAFFAMTTDDKFIPLVGASGAISGLMGGFAGYYGLKKIRYFFWIFVFFSYIRLPALLVLGYWLLKELLQSGNNDGVAYMAHFGGLVAGFLCVLLLKRQMAAKQESIDTSKVKSVVSTSDSFAHSVANTQTSPQIALKQKAKAAVKDLNFDLAKDYYYQLLNQEPHNAGYFRELFNLEKDQPKSRAFKALVENIVSKSQTNSSLERLADTAMAEVKAQLMDYRLLDVDILMGYCQQSLKRKNPLAIRSVVNFLIKVYPEHPALPDILLHFAFAMEQAGDWNTKHKVLSFLSSHYASTFAGREAQKELAANH